jgi:hypothetical protein
MDIDFGHTESTELLAHKLTAVVAQPDVDAAVATSDEDPRTRH